MTTCSRCGRENDEGAEFCLGCGHFLAWADEPRRRRRRPTTDAPSGTAPDPDVDAGPREPAAPEPPSPEPPEPEPPKPEPPKPEPEPPAPTTTTHDLIRVIDQGADLAAERRRPDLAAGLDRAGATLTSATSTVVVIGEFKRGKSTLINALLHTAVCPVDADVVTAVPTIVSYGREARVTAYTQDPRDGSTATRELTLRDLPSVVGERSTVGAPVLVRSVEVRVPHRMLRAGLRLVDTPGVGGLDSAHGFLTLGSLAMADGALFVTDASQELTAPELQFLKEVVGHSPRTAVVVTKTDLYPEWRRIVELDRSHLGDAGLALPVIPVSSFLRLRAALEPTLNAESGFLDLVRYVATDIVRPTTEKAALTAAREVEFVVSQLAEEAAVERTVLERPAQAPEVLARLRREEERVAALAAGGASWQQALSDGVQDLVADVDHDLQERMRAILKDVDAIIDEGDPKEIWPETEVWLRRQVALAAVANRSLLVSRARDLTRAVAERFELDAGRAFETRLVGTDDVLSTLPQLGDIGPQPGKLAAMIVAARSSMYVPMVLFGMLVNAPATLVLAFGGAAVALGAGIGQKIIRDELRRQRTYRQQQAKIVSRKFVDDVAFVLNKDSRDALRLTQRQLRDDFQVRATVMHRSSRSALEAAERAAAMDRDDQQARSEELAAETTRIARVRAATRVAVTGAAAVATGVAAHEVIEALVDDD